MTGEEQNRPQGDANDAPPPQNRPAQPQGRGDGAIPLFQFAGINVRLHLMWFAVLAYFIYIEKGAYKAPEWAAVECVGLFGMVLLHEFGHAFACRSTGGKADRIMLWPLGGVAYVQPPARPGAFLWSIAAGPLVNVALIPVFYVASHLGEGQLRANSDLLTCIRELERINMGLLMFNMLPIYPLDGGQIVQSLLWFVIGRAYSLAVVAVIGFAVAVGAIAEALTHPGVIHIPFTPMYISSFWCFLLALFMFQRSSIAYKQAGNMMKVQRMPRTEGFACPSCREKPVAGDLWVCEVCNSRFDMFATGAVCPNCGHAHEKTECPFCRELNPIALWRR